MNVVKEKTHRLFRLDPEVIEQLDELTGRHPHTKSALVNEAIRLLYQTKVKANDNRIPLATR